LIVAVEMGIRILSDEVAALIAAGEVVERPASVVKELIENSLDAGAGNVSISAVGGGKRLIRVVDDGEGVPADEVELAFMRHSTSKLATAEDLTRIETLGFRGEALASIAAVSRLTMVTRWRAEEVGTRLRLEAGRVEARDMIGAPTGTVVTVENLFFNTPARLKFLKSDTTERHHIDALVTRYAMAYPGVRFALEQDGREVFRSSGNGSLYDVLVDVLGVDDASAMLEVEGSGSLRSDLPEVWVGGFTSAPHLNRSNRGQITLFVNGRWVQDSQLSYAVIQAYHTLLPSGRYPVAVVLVEVAPEEVDVNVHPAKAEVRFRHREAVFGAVQRAVRRALVDQAPAPSLGSGVVWGSPEWAARRERLTQATRTLMGQSGLDLPDASPGRPSQQRQPADQQEGGEARLPMLRVVGQVGTTYIVAEGPEGLYLIDQHAAHERILYEQFMAARSQPIARQELLEAQVVRLPPEQMALLEESLDDLQAVGFAVEVFGNDSVLVRAVPALVAEADPAEALRAALDDTECGKMPAESTAEARLIARVCKQAAIKAGQTLSYQEMQTMLRQLEACESPTTCPHGRPTMLHLSAAQLAREFGRV
jgi:DNA mismatch repair protein MutL